MRINGLLISTTAALCLTLASCSSDVPEAKPTVTATVLGSPQSTPTPSASVDCDTADQATWTQYCAGEGEPLDDDTAPPLAVSKIGAPVLLAEPDGSGTANITVHSITRRAPDPKSYGYTPAKYGAYIVLKITVRTTKGKVSTSGLRFSFVPDADTGTGTPEYQEVFGVSGMGEDVRIYDGDVPAGKHVTGEIYFEAPKGAYTVVLNMGNIEVGLFDLASWRYQP